MPQWLVRKGLKMAIYEMREDGTTFDRIKAESADAALDTLGLDHSDYCGDDKYGPAWAEVHAVNAADEDDYVTRDILLQPHAPECAHGAEHDWQAPLDLVGGIAENPGVFGHGGGVVINECCMNCGCKRITDTWAQHPVNGTQGHTTVRYEPGAYELADDEAERDDDTPLCPCGTCSPADVTCVSRD